MSIKDMLLYKCLCVWEAELFTLQPSLALYPRDFGFASFSPAQKQYSSHRF